MSSPKFDAEIRAKGIARSSFAALKIALSAGALPPCPYYTHRLYDWRLASGGPATCGVCHPPVAGLAVEVVT